MTPTTRTICAAVLSLCCLLAVATTAQTPRLSQQDMRTWLTYLSSDQLQGREVFTEGLGLARTYLAERLREFGVAPAGDAGTYFQQVRVLGVRTRSNASVTVTANGQSRTFKDGEGVTFPRNMGARQRVTGSAAFAGYGVRFAPLGIDDYKGRDVRGKVVLFVGRAGPKNFTAAHVRLLNARGREATQTHHAVASIGPVALPAGAGRGAQTGPGAGRGTQARGGRGGNAAQQVDFTTAQRFDGLIAPQITAGDEFYAFVFNAAGLDYTAMKAAADSQNTLPDVTVDALNAVSIAIDVDAQYDVVRTQLTSNVVGMIPGTDSRLKDTYVLLGAHYDHVGYEEFAPQDRLDLIAACAGQSRPTPRPGDIINNGADDDGSGTVVLMALAKAFAQGPRTKRSLLFVWHTGEEAGLYGSRYMADNPVVPLERVSAQLNIDMVGRNNCDDPAEANTLYLVGSDRISTELHNINEAANAALRAPFTLNYAYNDVADLESIYTRSDHYSYAAKGIPIVFYTTGVHRDYHYVTDEIDKILFPKMEKVASLIYGTTTRVANLGHPPSRDNLGPRVGKGRSGPIRPE